MQNAALINMLRLGASSRLTLAGMLGLLLAVVAGSKWGAPGTWVVAPLLVLALNLVCALFVNRRLRANGVLLGFHVCLLLLVVLVAWRELVYFEGRLELVEGATFDPELIDVIDSGPLHRQALMGGAFVQEDIAVDYGPRMTRGRTHSQIRVAGGHSAVVGDDSPLLLGRYRFYTTSNKGFAAVLTWTDSSGAAQVLVHFPSFPVRFDAQSNRVHLPKGETVSVRLPSSLPDDRVAWRLDRSHGGSALELRVGKAWQSLSRGQLLERDGGTLRFDGIRMWMGYEVRHEPVLPWIFSAALLSVALMSWYLFGGRLIVPTAIPGSVRT